MFTLFMYKVRTRLYKVTREDQLRAGCAVQLMQKGTCSGKREVNSTEMHISVCLYEEVFSFVCLFVCPITTHEPLFLA